MPISSFRFPLTRIELKRILPDHEALVTRMSLTSYRDEVIRGMVVVLSTQLAAGSPRRLPEIIVPNGWWNAFKAEVLAPLAERLRLPFFLHPHVDYLHHQSAEVIYQRLCPHAMSRPGHDHVEFLLQLDESRGDPFDFLAGPNDRMPETTVRRR